MEGQKPSVGRIVDYIPTEDERKAHNYADVAPAIITAVWGENTINVKVFGDASEDYCKTSIMQKVSEEQQGGYWQWPKRV